jgi:hypothetical protein
MSGYFFPSDGNGESNQGSLAPYLETVYSNERLESRFTSELEFTWQVLVENNVCEDTAAEKTAFIAREEQRYFKIRDAVQEAAAGYGGGYWFYLTLMKILPKIYNPSRYLTLAFCAL